MKKVGFTLVEVLFVAAFTILVTGFVVTNFSGTRNELGLVSTGIVSDVRHAQSRAVSGTLFEGVHRCGYGVVFEPTRYMIYAAPDAGSTDCDLNDHVYDSLEDSIVLEVVLDAGLTITTVGDVYFEPPLPKTYLNGVRGAGSIDITVVQGNAACPSSACHVITIHESGQVRIQ